MKAVFARQLFRLLIERNLKVLLPEEFGIGKPRRQHFFIARDNRRAAIIRHNIGGADKGVGKLILPACGEDLPQPI